MLRIIQGIPFLGKPADYIKVKAHDLGNGHLEVMGYRPTVWQEANWSPDYLADVLEVIRREHEKREADPVLKMEHRQAMAEKAAKRAKKRVRQLCKAMGVDTLLTLTYKANETDLARCKADLKEFIRRLRRVVPGFQAVAGFEQQERGAWHVHLACNRFDNLIEWKGAKVKSYNVIRAVWRSVTKERGGTANVKTRKNRGYGRQRQDDTSPAKIAAYIAKYVTKNYADGEKWSNRWTKFGEATLPEPVDLGEWPDMRDALASAFGLMLDGQIVANAKLSRWGDSFFLFAEAG